MNIRPPYPISNEFIKMQDEFLGIELAEKGIIDFMKLETVPSNNKLCLWRGDITTLQIDAIVNAANEQMLGCFIPCHGCIDNAIQNASSPQGYQSTGLWACCNKYGDF